MYALSHLMPTAPEKGGVIFSYLSEDVIETLERLDDSHISHHHSGIGGRLSA